VLATIHSSSAAEALQRIISAFPSEIQNSIAAQLADCLAGVICQRLRVHQEAGIRVPECEILQPTHAVRNFIRRGEFQQVPAALETGADHGMWTFARYRNWMAAKRDWYVPSKKSDGLEAAEPAPVRSSVPRVSSGKTAPAVPPSTGAVPSPAKPDASGRIEIEPEEGFG